MLYLSSTASGSLRHLRAACSRGFPRLVLLCALTLTTPMVADQRPETEPLPNLQDLGWLAGPWVADQDGAKVEEIWIEPAGGTMLGVLRATAEGRTQFFEFLRIEATEKGRIYHASPRGRPAVAFRSVSAEDRELIFENPEHDFPQRIVYRLREDGTLHVRTETLSGDRVVEWLYRRP